MLNLVWQQNGWKVNGEQYTADQYSGLRQVERPNCQYSRCWNMGLDSRWAFFELTEIPEERRSRCGLQLLWNYKVYCHGLGTNTHLFVSPKALYETFDWYSWRIIRHNAALKVPHSAYVCYTWKKVEKNEDGSLNSLLRGRNNAWKTECPYLGE